MTTVLIADDHALIRAGLKDLLAQERSITQVGEASTGSEAVDRLDETGWDLLILDIQMPDRSGVEILRHTRSTHPHTRTLMLSGYPERQYAANLLRAGADGYINKDADPEEMLTAIQMVLRGRRYMSPHLAEQRAMDLGQGLEGPQHSHLSTREFQIFRKLAMGQPVTAIARELDISAKTVSTYRSRILEKMHFTSNADLTAYAIRNQLI